MISNKQFIPCYSMLALQPLSGQLEQEIGALHRQTVTDSREALATDIGIKVAATADQPSLQSSSQEPLPPCPQAIAEVPDEERINLPRDSASMPPGTFAQNKP